MPSNANKPKPRTKLMTQAKHIADAEETFFVKAITPDFCCVGKAIVPFMPYRELSHEKTGFSTKVLARDRKILLVQSIVQGVKSNAGKGLKSGVSRAAGNVKVVNGHQGLFVEGRVVSRHGDLCEMNGKA